jgi:hypothetical protein
VERSQNASLGSVSLELFLSSPFSFLFSDTSYTSKDAITIPRDEFQTIFLDLSRSLDVPRSSAALDRKCLEGRDFVLDTVMLPVLVQCLALSSQCLFWGCFVLQ